MPLAGVLAHKSKFCFRYFLLSFLLSTFLEMRLATKFANICGGSNKRFPRFTVDDTSDEPFRSPWWADLDRVRLVPHFKLSELADIQIPRRDVKGSHVQDVAGVEVDRWYVGVGYRCNLVVAPVRLKR